MFQLVFASCFELASSLYFLCIVIQFKEDLSVSQRFSECKYENLCPRIPDLKLPFDFCFLKNDVPKLCPGYTTDYVTAV